MDISHVEIKKSIFIDCLARFVYEYFYEYSPLRHGWIFRCRSNLSCVSGAIFRRRSTTL